MSKPYARKTAERQVTTLTPTTIESPWENITPEFRNAVKLADEGKLEQALGKFVNMPPSPLIRNATGVIYMRQGKVNEAVSLLRSVVLQMSCTWLREGVPNYCRLNYATALLMSGHLGGAIQIIFDAGDKTSEQTKELNAAIDKWYRLQPWWKKLDWKLGGVSHSHEGIIPDSVPGVFFKDAASIKYSDPLPRNR